MRIAVITTFPNNSWDVYAKKALQSFVQFWPAEIPLLVQLDDEFLYHDVNKILRPQDGIAVGWQEDHKAFVERNKHKDSPDNYRFQATRFCHKVFAIKRALDGIKAHKADAETKPDTVIDDTPRYLIWLDADVITTRPVTVDDIQGCLPKEGDAVAYLGRKEWGHSECGWLAFDLQQLGDALIRFVYEEYVSDAVFSHEEWHDSWIWDIYINKSPRTNLSENAKGLDAWSASPMAQWSTHYKGPLAKQGLQEQKIMSRNGSNVIIQTRNAIPDEKIREHIAENQKLITKWITPCKPHDEEIIIVSAGPQLDVDEVKAEALKGKKIVAVKHVMERLKKAEVPIWATILLDPRPHVYDFVQEPDKNAIWFVASQVDPKVTRHLLDKGCTVWGYHAAVAANESSLTNEQLQAVVEGGTATATRGLYVLERLGFSNFTLYGYELSYPDKPDLKAVDEKGQPKYLEISVAFNDPENGYKKCFFTEPQFIAQFEEIREIILAGKLKIKAFGDGIVPFLVKCKKSADARRKARIEKLTGGIIPDYQSLLRGGLERKTLFHTLIEWMKKVRLPAS